MSFDITLSEALASVVSKGLKERAEGLSDLRQILRHNQSNSKIANLKDASFYKIFTTLFDTVKLELVTLHEVRVKPSKTTESATNARLNSCAAAVRVAVDVGIRNLRSKSVKAIVDHIISNFVEPSGIPYVALADDYCKCLSNLFGYEPHVEHLPHDLWEKATTFCLETINSACASDGGLGSSILSARSSHFPSGSQASSNKASLKRQALDDIVNALRSLTSVSFASLIKQASQILAVMVQFLSTSSHMQKPQIDALVIVNNVLLQIRTEEISLTKEFTRKAIILARNLWNTKLTALKDEVLIMLVLIHPYIDFVSQDSEDGSLPAELGNLVETLRGEYVKRAAKDQLQISHLTLRLANVQSPIGLRCEIFALRDNLPTGENILSSEHNWTLVKLLTLISMQSSSQETKNSKRSGSPGAGSQKRIRVASWSDDFLRMFSDSSLTTRICSLQMICFAAQSATIDQETLGNWVERLTASISDESSAIASWVHLALASCATQSSAHAHNISQTWKLTWDHALRAVNSSLTGRTACHLLHTLIHAGLVDRSTMLGNIGTMLSTIAVNGPTVFADSVASLLKTIVAQLQRESTSLSAERVEQILTWLFRTWAPSNFHDKMFASQNPNIDLVDILDLINICLGRSANKEPVQILPVWGSVAQSWILHAQTQDLLEYLLLLKKKNVLLGSLSGTFERAHEMSPSVNTASATLALDLCLTETKGAIDKWDNVKEQSTGHVDRHMIRMVSILAMVSLCLANCLQAKDIRRTEQLHAANEKLLQLLVRDLSSSYCEQSKVDVLVDLVAHNMAAENSVDPGDESHRSHICMSKLSIRLLDLFEKRREMTQPDSIAQKNDLSGSMDIDTDFESQGTSITDQIAGTCPPRKVISNDFSAAAQNASVTVYAQLMQTRSLSGPDHDSNGFDPEAFVSQVLALTPSKILASGPILGFLPRYGLQLTSKQFEPLLEFFAETTLQSYEHERAETNMYLLLALMESFVDTWTNASDRDLYTFGLDIYKWFTVTAMKARLLSPTVLKRVVQLMFQVLQIDAEYGQSDNLQPVRSMLFHVMQKSSLEITHFVAQHISLVFSLFSLPVHHEILEELASSLPKEIDCVEGLAVRILVFSKLASKWHTLRRRCIYHIFETAGMLSDSEKYAAACVSTISDALKLKSTQEVFRLFSPQLLFSWLENHPVAKIPFSVFGYESIVELLEHNLDEIYSQLCLRERKVDEIKWVVETLQSTDEQVFRNTFSKSVAYAISWDVCVKQGQDSSQTATACEAPLRGLLKTGGEYYLMVQSHLPDILAQIFNSVYHEELIEKVLEKREQYSYAKEALIAMKQYGFLDQELTQSQQPSFKSRYLLDQLERVCRRTGNKSFTTIKEILDVASITATLRSIIDFMHPAYGPLHACQTVRKLRIFIALAGDDVFNGYPLQALIRTLQPTVIDPHCSDDAMGVLRYLFERGRDFLSQEMSMVTGTALLMLLSLKQFMKSRQDKTTQESQFRNTVSKMQTFHDWLVEYLLQLRSVFSTEQQKTAFTSLVQACRDLELPVSAETDQAASSMLKGLLDDEESESPILGSIERRQVISTLCQQFRLTDKGAEDVFASDELSLAYAKRVWASVQEQSVADDYRAWAARVLGRAYASKVSLEQIQPTTGLISHLTDSIGGQNQSTRAVVTKLLDLLSSDNQTYVGVAEQSLRKISHRFVSLDDPNGSIEFEQMLPPDIVSATSRAYGKDLLQSKESQKFGRGDLWSASKFDRNKPFEFWVQNLAVALCRWSKDDPIIGPLENVFLAVDGFSRELFPFLLHLALNSEVEKERVVRAYISESCTSHFKDHGNDTNRKSRLLLETLLYLLTQPLPRERTRMGRLEWLELDYLVAAEAAAKCNIPTAALYLGEIGAVPEVEPRISRRSSINPDTNKTLSSELLLSIYSSVDDPDSFYGVRQPPSLESVLARVHHEGDGLKGMMLHSARMDASLRRSGQPDESDSSGMIGSVGAMNLNSLTHDLLYRKGGNQSNTSTTDTMLESARKLEQWDIVPPQMNVSAASTLYSVFRNLATATTLDVVQLHLNEAFGRSIQNLKDPRLDASALRATLSSIAILNEVDELTTVRCASDLSDLWTRMQARQKGWDIGRFNDAQGIVSYRETLFSLLGQNKNLREALHVSIRDCRVIETRSVISSSQFARNTDLIQQSLTAATYLSQLVPVCQEINVKMDAAAQFEVASTLWRQGETSTSVQMLQELCARTDLTEQSVQVGRAGMLAQLGHEVAEARLEKPDEVIANYLKPAIKQLGQATSGSEAGRVYYEFASFCDQQLQDPGNLEDFQRLTKLRERKLTELEQYEALVKTASTKEQKHELRKQQRVVNSWYTLDDEEYQKQLKGRDEFVRQSLQNYLRALEASDEFDASVVRFFALWLENSESESANRVVQQYLPRVPSWKFVGLMNQQTSRLQKDSSVFQKSLSALIYRVCLDHPYHGVHYLYTTCMSSVAVNEQAGTSRREAAHSLARKLHSDGRVGKTINKSFKVSHAYQTLANTKVDARKTTGKITINTLQSAKDMVEAVALNQVPPATMSVDLRPDADYSKVPIVARYRDDIRIANGLSAPKVMVAIGTDGNEYKQLFKGGNDDLRQDAIMEQVFGEVSKMLQHHKSSRQRNLHVRTYKVLPLTSTCGIIEFVPHSMPLGEFLVPAHIKYHPSDLKQNAAREKIGNAQGMPKDTRVKVYREVAARHQPVLRHFFFERFQDPDDWFQKRLNYTRSTATISILGWVLGLGDRHCHNILLDEQSGEAIHIDLGVAFEAGRVLPVPEVVPFRLTRDIVDGMGVTKTEGVFRRCCEFSMDALRADKDAIMTLLNVLRYDPLYSWTVSPLKARRMQDPRQQEDTDGEGSSAIGAKRPEDEAGEAARALAIVEKKLSKTLSTAATVNELIQQATDERNLAVLFAGWAPYA